MLYLSKTDRVLVTQDSHGNDLGDTSANEVAHTCSPEIVEERSRLANVFACFDPSPADVLEPLLVSILETHVVEKHMLVGWILFIPEVPL